MLEIILARHGETAWNIAEVFRGRSNVDLNETGMKQAELLAEYLSGRTIQAIYSSPLQRACKTAQAIALRHNLRVMPVEGLNDMSFGVWEGVPVAEVRTKYPKLFGDWIANPHLVQIPGGETFDEVAKRALAFVDDTVKKHTGTVVLVSHRVVHKILILRLLGLDLGHFWNVELGTAAMTTFTYESRGFCLREHNNTSYLITLKSTGK